MTLPGAQAVDRRGDVLDILINDLSEVVSERSFKRKVREIESSNIKSMMEAAGAMDHPMYGYHCSVAAGKSPTSPNRKKDPKQEDPQPKGSSPFLPLLPGQTTILDAYGKKPKVSEIETTPENITVLRRSRRLAGIGKEGTNEQTNKGANEQTNEGTNDRMNERTNEQTNE